MNLFICGTSYQLLNAISIVINTKEKADLIITRQSIAESCDMKYLSSLGYFLNIYIWTELFEKISTEHVRSKKDVIFRILYIAQSIVGRNKMWNSLPNKNKNYYFVFMGYVDYPSKNIYAYFKKKGSRLGLYDEGTYTYGCLDIKPSFFRKLADKVLFGNVLIDDTEVVFLRMPEKIRLGNHINVKLIKINHVSMDKARKNILKVFNVRNDNIVLLSRSLILFDQNLESNEIREAQFRIAEICCDVVGKDNVLIKLHPASRRINYPMDCRIYKDRVPFEIIMDSFDMNNKILLSIFSTACFSPKQIMNQEPYVIFIYKILKNCFQIDEKYLRTIDDLKKEYSDKNKIFVPCSIDELKKVLSQISQNIQKN